jgi:nucleotide-binding universal stress UspA family protein
MVIELTKILVPIALSPSCAWAVQYSAQLANRFGSKLLFLHVGNCPRETVETFLGQGVKDTSYELTICQGDPADAIVQFATETSPSLIVMPTHSHGKFRRFLLGSVTAKVLHDVERPILTGIHHETAPLSTDCDIRQIICAVDIDEGFVPVVRSALALARLFDAALTVVHAIPAVDETSDNRGEIEVRNYLFRLAEEKFGQLKREAEVDVTISLAGGAVATVIREAALRTGADLVVIGRGHTQRELGRLRTQAYSIIRHSPCPVIGI